MLHYNNIYLQLPFNMTALIELKHISVTFGTRKVLDNVSLQLHRKKIITLIGPNGAGKSTLVKVLLGLHPNYHGQIISEKNLRIGYVPQKLKLNSLLPLTVKRFLALAGKYREQEFHQALDLVGAQHLIDLDMHSLSGGENQRVLLARALLRRPDILVLDEPAQGVDVQGQIELYALIDKIRHRFDCAIFIVSHDLHLVMAKTDDVICLQHHICCSGTPELITQHPNYIALFGNAHALAFYKHEHQHQHNLAGESIEEKHDCNHRQKDKSQC